MSAGIVFQQMLVIFLLIAAGFYLFYSKTLPESASGVLSTLISKVCNPALILSTAFDDSNTATVQDLITVAVVAVVLYAVLLLMSWLLPVLLRIAPDQRKFYGMMTVYGNIGFMGIPVASAVLGSEVLIYLTVFLLVFNILIYSHGMILLGSGTEDGTKGLQWKRMINIGTVASVIALVVFVLNIPVHVVLSDAVSYIGRCTTFISMLVLGGSIARMSPREIFGEKKLYGFTAIRFFLLPVLAALLLPLFVSNTEIVGISVLTLALPVANLPLMLAEEQGLECRVLARGIILTTLLSIFSVTLAMAML